MDIKYNWWKTAFNDKFYKIYYHYLKPNYLAYINNIIKFSKLKKENKILDLACGSGSHLIIFKKKGFNNLTGLDYNCVKMAKKNTKDYDILVKKGDMRKEFGCGIYGFIMITSTSFGYFSDDENKKVLRNCYKALKLGGKLFVDNLSQEFITANFQQKNWTKFKEDTFLLEERVLSKDNKYLLSTWHLLEKGEIHKLVNKLRLYSREEFKKLFKEAGFKNVKIEELKTHNWFLAEK